MDVIVFSNGCPKCEVLKKKLFAKGIAFKTSEEFDALKAFKIDTLPVLVVDSVMYTNYGEMINWVDSQEYLSTETQED